MYVLRTHTNTLTYNTEGKYGVDLKSFSALLQAAARSRTS
jgi:hypothetical protein